MLSSSCCTDALKKCPAVETIRCLRLSATTISSRLGFKRVLKYTVLNHTGVPCGSREEQPGHRQSSRRPTINTQHSCHYRYTHRCTCADTRDAARICQIAFYLIVYCKFKKKKKKSFSVLRNYIYGSKRQNLTSL